MPLPVACWKAAVAQSQHIEALTSSKLQTPSSSATGVQFRSWRPAAQHHKKTRYDNRTMAFQVLFTGMNAPG